MVGVEDQWLIFEDGKDRSQCSKRYTYDLTNNFNTANRTNYKILNANRRNNMRIVRMQSIVK